MSATGALRSVVAVRDWLGGPELFHFLPGLHPDASTLTLVPPSPGRDPLLTLTIDL